LMFARRRFVGMLCMLEDAVGVVVLVDDIAGRIP
jgi:hypothetical protein